MNLLARNNIRPIYYCGQISLQKAAVNCSFSDNLTPLRVTIILPAMVHTIKENNYYLLAIHMPKGYEKNY